MKIVFEILVTMLFALSVLADESLSDRAKKWFTKEEFDSSTLLWEKYMSEDYNVFLKDFGKAINSNADEAKEVKDYILGITTSFDFCVYDVKKNNFPKADALKAKGNAVMRFYAYVARMNDVESSCRQIMVGLGKMIDNSDDEKNLAGIVYRLVDDTTYNNMTKGLDTNVVWRSLWNGTRYAATSVVGYRDDMMRMCGTMVREAKAKMPISEFIAFTNEIVKLSHATRSEQETLFYDIKWEEEGLRKRGVE